MISKTFRLHFFAKLAFFFQETAVTNFFDGLFDDQIFQGTNFKCYFDFLNLQLVQNLSCIKVNVNANCIRLDYEIAFEN